jgi:CubicO group peptidase (beta-lactamase class C family)
MTKHEAFGTLPLIHLYTPLLPGLLDTSALIHKRQGKLLWLNRVYIDATPSTGLIGPSTDIARFMIAYLNHGSLDGNLLLQPESVTMLTETPPMHGHGLGWSMGASNNARYLEHAGGGPGFATIMRLYPEKGLGLAILANGTNLDREGLMDMLTKMEW